jgi:hypothetical protein
MAPGHDHGETVTITIPKSFTIPITSTEPTLTTYMDISLKNVMGRTMHSREPEAVIKWVRDGSCRPAERA